MRDHRPSNRRGSVSSATDNNTITDNYHPGKFDSDLANMASSGNRYRDRTETMAESFYQGKRIYGTYVL